MSMILSDDEVAQVESIEVDVETPNGSKKNYKCHGNLRDVKVRVQKEFKLPGNVNDYAVYLRKNGVETLLKYKDHDDIDEMTDELSGNGMLVFRNNGGVKPKDLAVNVQ